MHVVQVENRKRPYSIHAQHNSTANVSVLLLVPVPVQLRTDSLNIQPDLMRRAKSALEWTNAIRETRQQELDQDIRISCQERMVHPLKRLSSFK